MPKVVVIDCGLDEARVKSPFEAKDYIKALPYWTRSWDQDNRVWVVDLDQVDTLVGYLQEGAFQVVVKRPGKQGEHTKAASVTTWADQMYTELGRDLGDKVHKVVSRVLHPDCGGSLEAMKALNVARDRAATQQT